MAGALYIGSAGNVARKIKTMYIGSPGGVARSLQKGFVGTPGAVARSFFNAFTLPVYTGQHAIFGDETRGKIECYSSGELTLCPYVYDVFLVGGGGHGRSGGGGGGYTFTQIGVEIFDSATVIIGAGAANYQSDGGATACLTYQALGGRKITVANARPGGNGGSGGGAGGADLDMSGAAGGSNGNNGNNSISSRFAYYGGTGQLASTRAFLESNGGLYAGGGGGNGQSATSEGEIGQGGPGGAGGGGKGADGGGYGAQSGTPNTGGGGGGFTGGGSGIVIVRWGY